MNQNLQRKKSLISVIIYFGNSMSVLFDTVDLFFTRQEEIKI